jgi:outer membrane protein assembly factor BamB
VWKAPSGSDAPIFIGGGVSGSAQSDAHPTALAFVSVDAGGPHWSRMLDGRVLAAILAGQHVVVRTIGGRIIVLARKDGTTVRELPALGVLPNVALCRGANDTLVMAAESRIACVEMLEHPVAQAADATVWERKNRLRGLIPPAWTAIATDGDSIVAGRTDGTIAALDISDGATRWEGRTGSSIRRVAADPASVRVFALTHDGRLLALDAGKIAWTRDVEVGHESHAEPALLCTPGHIWIASPATNALMCLDPGDGRILGTLVWSSDLFWSARERTVVVADAGGVDAFRAP